MRDSAKKRIRSSNIELLRILSMFGVIFMHYSNPVMGGAIAYVSVGSISYYLLYMMISLVVCAVDLFMLISGYFLCTTKRRNLWKPLELLLQVSLFNAGIYLLQLILARSTFSISGFLGSLIPANYFIILYIAVYIISPFINIIFENLNSKQMNLFLGILVVIFSIYPTAIDVFSEITGSQWVGLSTIGAYGSQWGYTVTNFILMYAIGAYLRLGNLLNGKISQKQMVIGIVSCVTILSVWAVINDATGFYTERSAWEYCNPIVILMAVLVFSLFSRIEMGHNRIVNRLSEGVFSVYLLHNLFLPYIGIREHACKGPVILGCHFLISAVSIYLACWVIHVVYTAITRAVFKRLLQRLDFLSFDLSVW